MTNGNDSSRFVITLRENGVHSFVRGLRAYEEYTKTQDEMLLKDVMMFLHHGIELLMKQILVQHSPYLIFDDIRQVPAKQRQADSQGTGIFFLSTPPRTTTYTGAIDRVDGLVAPGDLDRSLLERLAELNSRRNQLQHYAIDVNKGGLIRLLAALLVPLVRFFEHHLGPIPDLESADIRRIQGSIDREASNEYRLIAEVIEVVGKFKGQTIPGHLLGMDEPVTLPKLTNVDSEVFIAGLAATADIAATGDEGTWVIEVRERLSGRPERILKQMSLYARHLGATSWLVVFAEVPSSFREIAQSSSLMVSGIHEWRELKRLIGV